MDVAFVALRQNLDAPVLCATQMLQRNEAHVSQDRYVSRTVLRVRPTQRQLIPRFRTKSLQRESRQFRAKNCREQVQKATLTSLVSTQQEWEHASDSHWQTALVPGRPMPTGSHTDLVQAGWLESLPLELSPAQKSRIDLLPCRDPMHNQRWSSRDGQTPLLTEAARPPPYWRIGACRVREAAKCQDHHAL